MVLSNCCCKPLIHTFSDRSSKIVRDLSFFKLYIYLSDCVFLYQNDKYYFWAVGKNILDIS